MWKLSGFSPFERRASAVRPLFRIVPITLSASLDDLALAADVALGMVVAWEHAVRVVAVDTGNRRSRRLGKGARSAVIRWMLRVHKHDGPDRQ